MTVESAEADGRKMGEALAQRPPDERAAWWRGLQAAVGGPDVYRGLPLAPDGWAWAEDVAHVLTGSVGLAHLIPRPGGPSGPYTERLGERSAVSVCGLDATAWVTVGRWETDRREACPQCAGQRTTSMIRPGRPT